jgi:hypothetical protein
MGLLEDDAQWDSTMVEAALARSPVKLTNLFILSLITCGPSNPEQLRESYKKPLIEDILLQAHQRNPGIALNYTSDMFYEILLIMENKVLEIADKDLRQIDLLSSQRNHCNQFTREMLRENSYDVNELNTYVLTNEPLLVLDKRAAYNAILD